MNVFLNICIIQTVSAKQEKCGNLKPTIVEFLDRKHFHLKTVNKKDKNVSKRQKKSRIEINATTMVIGKSVVNVSFLKPMVG